jgi:hypothetical protein
LYFLYISSLPRLKPMGSNSLPPVGDDKHKKHGSECLATVMRVAVCATEHAASVRVWTGRHAGALPRYKSNNLAAPAMVPASMQTLCKLLVDQQAHILQASCSCTIDSCNQVMARATSIQPISMSPSSAFSHTFSWSNYGQTLVKHNNAAAPG